MHIDPTLGRVDEEDLVLSGPGEGDPGDVPPDVPAAAGTFPGGVTETTAAVGAGAVGGLLVALAALVRRRRRRRA